MKKILDSHALLVYLEKEKGYEKVMRILKEAAQHREYLLMTTVNFGEIYYITSREYGESKAEEIESLVRRLPVEIIDVDMELAREAARFKVSGRLSYADCFAAALTKMKKGILLTGDREFNSVEREIKIDWIS